MLNKPPSILPWELTSARRSRALTALMLEQPICSNKLKHSVCERDITAEQTLSQRNETIEGLKQASTQDIEATNSEQLETLGNEMRMLKEQETELRRVIARLRAQQQVSEQTLLQIQAVEESQSGPTAFTSIQREKVALDNRLLQVQKSMERAMSSLDAQAIRMTRLSAMMQTLNEVSAKYMGSVDPSVAALADAAIDSLTGISVQLPLPLEAPPASVAPGVWRIPDNMQIDADERARVIAESRSFANRCVEDVASQGISQPQSIEYFIQQCTEADDAPFTQNSAPLALFRLMELEIIRLNGELSLLLESLADKTDEVDCLASALSEIEKAADVADKRAKRAVSRSSAARSERARELRDNDGQYAATMQNLQLQLNETRFQLTHSQPQTPRVSRIPLTNQASRTSDRTMGPAESPTVTASPSM